MPDISNWDTENVKNINRMFFCCKFLSKLPDISKWKISDKTEINELFYGCESLTLIPKIEKWDIFKEKNYYFFKYFDLFEECISLVYLPNNSLFYKNCINCINNQKKEKKEKNIV